MANFFFVGFEAINVVFLVRTVHLAPASVGLLIALTTRGAGLAFYVIGTVVLLIGILIQPDGHQLPAGVLPTEILGRVIATMRFVLFGTIPLGALVGGILGSVLPVRDAVEVLHLGNCLPGLILATSPLRQMRDLPDRPAGLPSSAEVMPHT